MKRYLGTLPVLKSYFYCSQGNEVDKKGEVFFSVCDALVE